MSANHGTRASNRTLELRGLLHSLAQLTKDLGPDSDVEEAVDAGRELWRVCEAAQRALEKVKDRVRTEVNGAAPGQQELLGADGSLCSIMIPQARIVLRPDVDLSKLQHTLGPKKFDRLFCTRTSVLPHKDFIDRAADLRADSKSLVLASVDTVTNKARVSFSKTRRKVT